jgi:hypothetical protein
MMTLFTASTLNGWTDIMESGLDIEGIDMQPRPFASIWLAPYFILYVLIMSFFVTNLFIGVLVDFIKHSDGSALLTEEQQSLVDLHKFQKIHRPKKRQAAPTNPIRMKFFGLVESQVWDKVSHSAIIFNVIVMMCEYEDQTREWEQTLDVLNFGCLCFFTMEFFFKIIGLYPARYFRDNWNRFDAFVILISWLAMVFESATFQAIRAIRSLRIVLVLKGAKGIRSLFRTLLQSVPSAINITILLCLLYSLYAILGMQLFGNAPLQDIECTAAQHRDPATGTVEILDNLPEYCSVGVGEVEGRTDGRTEMMMGQAFGLGGGRPGHMMMGANRQYTRHANFRSFISSVKLLYQCSAGQDWKFVMYAVGGEPGQPGGNQLLAFAYFFTFFFLSNYILLNLFIAVILDNFASSMREQALQISEVDFEEFKCARTRPSNYVTEWHTCHF